MDKFLAIILAIILLLGYHPGHHPGPPAIILAIILVYPSFILPVYAIILPGRMMGTLSSWSSCTGLHETMKNTNTHRSQVFYADTDGLELHMSSQESKGLSGKRLKKSTQIVVCLVWKIISVVYNTHADNSLDPRDGKCSARSYLSA